MYLCCTEILKLFKSRHNKYCTHTLEDQSSFSFRREWDEGVGQEGGCESRYTCCQVFTFVNMFGQVDIDPLIVNRHHFPTAGRVALQDTPVVGLLLMIRGVGASLFFV